MNWDRVRREKPLIDHYDYSAMMDARERGVSLDGADLSERMAERRERLGIGSRQRSPSKRSGGSAKRGQQPPNLAGEQAVMSPRRPGESKGARDRRIARQLGIDVAEVKRIRAKLSAQEQRLKEEADRRGVSVKKLRRQLAQEGGTPKAASQAQRSRSQAKAVRSAPGATGAVVVSKSRRGRPAG